MLRNSARAMLLSASALTMFAYGAHAQTVTIPGGGASLPSQDYAGPLAVTNANPTAPSEEASFNAANSQFNYQYFTASSGRGQAAFSSDTWSAMGYTGSTPVPTTQGVIYAASDAFLAPSGATTIVNGFTYTTVAGISGTTADYPLRAGQDGALIQIPMLGLGIAIPAASGNAAVKANGKLHLTDNDLCGIFSGQITNYANISTPLAGLTGPISVYYRADSSGTSFLFTNHLKAVCNANNSSFPDLAAAPTTTFTNLFTGGSVPGNFHGETGSGALATAMAGTVTTSGGHTVGQPGDPSGIGYLSTDFTAISTNGKANDIAAPNPPGGFINSATLFDAGVKGAGETAFTTPTVGAVTSGLAHGAAGFSFQPKPPTGKAVNNPLKWVPSISKVTVGYPIVGTTTWELAQCYSDANVASGLTSFLTNHFNGNFNSIINANGFALPSAAYNTAIKANFLNSSSKLAIGTAGAGNCAGKSGR